MATAALRSQAMRRTFNSLLLARQMPMFAPKLAPILRPSFSTTARNAGIDSLMKKYDQNMKRQSKKQNSLAPRSPSGQSSEQINQAMEHLTGTLALGTYVTPPITRFPRSFQFTWTLLKRRVLDRLLLSLFAWGSKPKFLKRAQWKPKQSSIAAHAKALHRSMGEALAAGDKVALREVCVPALAEKLSAVIDARRRGVRKSWEVVRYNQTWRYPRLADTKLRVDPRHPILSKLPGVYQAVVTIASRQRLVEYDDTRGDGQIVPGSEKEVDLVEHVVVLCTVDQKTFAQTPWKIWGTTNETSLESLRHEEETMALAEGAGPDK